MVAVVACISVNATTKGKFGRIGAVEKRAPATGTETIQRSQGVHSKERWRVLKEVRMSSQTKNCRKEVTTGGGAGEYVSEKQ